MTKKGVLKTLEFTDAFLTGYSESTTALDDEPMVINCVISARELSLQGAVHKNIWDN